MAEIYPKLDAELGTVRMEQALLDAIDREAAEKDEGDRSPVVRRALKRYFSREHAGRTTRDMGRVFRNELRKFFKSPANARAATDAAERRLRRGESTK